VTNERIARETVLAELTARDLGHPVTINGMAGVLVRVLHEGGTEGLQPTYIRLLTAGLTESQVGRFHPETPVVVEPLTEIVEADVVEGTSQEISLTS
jgi:hypothetical protein